MPAKVERSDVLEVLIRQRMEAASPYGTPSGSAVTQEALDAMYLLDQLDAARAAIAEAEARGRTAERADVIAWLRSSADDEDVAPRWSDAPSALREVADEIAADEHHGEFAPRNAGDGNA